jgi:hypothetical protein
MRRHWSAIQRQLFSTSIIVLLVLPIFTYVYIFGTDFSTNHTRWAEMGSAMSGIYGPLLTYFTLFMITRQVLLQQETNKHMYDQAYLENARKDSDFYIEQISKELELQTVGVTCRAILLNHFERVTLAQLKGEVLKFSADDLNAHFPRLQAIWGAIYPIYTGLNTSDEVAYRLQLVSSQQKAIVMLGLPSCVALDNYLYCVTEGRMPFAYQFSSVHSM